MLQGESIQPPSLKSVLMMRLLSGEKSRNAEIALLQQVQDLQEVAIGESVSW